MIRAIFDLSTIDLLSTDPANNLAVFSDGLLTLRDPFDPNNILAEAPITHITAIHTDQFDQLAGIFRGPW
jgi:hypothetical protein